MNASRGQRPSGQYLYQRAVLQIIGHREVGQYRQARALAHGLAHAQRRIQRDYRMHGYALLLQLAAREVPAAGVTQGRVRHERQPADMLRLLELPHLPAHRGRSDQQLPEAPDLTGLHVEVGKPAHADRQLHLPRHQVERLVAEHGIHLALGVAPGELGDGRHHRRDAIVQRSGQAQDARRLGCHFPELVEGIACLLEDGCAALVEEPACVGGYDLAGGAGQ